MKLRDRPKQDLPPETTKDARKIRSKPLKEAYVMLLGYSEKEFEEQMSRKIPGLHLQKNLSDAITHVVLKPTAQSKTFHEWAPVFCMIIAGRFIVHPSWLDDCQKMGRIIDARKSLINKENLTKASQKDETLTAQRIIELACTFDQAGDRGSFFKDPTFQRILLVSGNTRDEQKRKRDLKILLETGGGHVLLDEIWTRIAASPSTAKDHCDIIVLVFESREKREGLIKGDLIEKLLIQKIPVLTDRMVYEMILGAGGDSRTLNLPTKTSNLLLSYQNWAEKLNWNNSQLFDWIVQEDPEQEMPECLREKLEKRRSSTRKSLPEKENSNETIDRKVKRTKMDVDELESGDLLAEFEAEIRFNDQRREEIMKFDDPKAVELETPRTQKTDFDTGPRTANILKLKTFTFPISKKEINELRMDPKMDWLDSVQKAKRLPKSTGIAEKLPNSPKSIDRFNILWAELGRYPVTSSMHTVITGQLIDSIRCSISDDFMPESTILSRLLYGIAMPNHGLDNELPSKIYSLILTFLNLFPPIRVDLRNYWLEVLSESDCDHFGKDRNRKTVRKNDPSEEAKKELLNRVHSFRQLVRDAFSHENRVLQHLVVEILEIDLWSCQFSLNTADGTLNRDDKSSTINYPADLKSFPLAYLVFYDPIGRKMNNFNTEAKQTLYSFVNQIKKRKEIHHIQVIGRLLALSLEAIRWFGENMCSNRELLIDGVPMTLRNDTKDLGRRLISKGLSKPQILELLPVNWIKDCIFSRD